MPDTAANEIQPAFQKNLDAIARTSPALRGLLDAILALNDADNRVFVSTDSNLHLYAGRDFILRIVFGRGSVLQLQPHTEKAIYEDANKLEADEFFRSVIALAIKKEGFKSGWADLDRAKNVLTIRAGVPKSFIDALCASVIAAARATEA